MNYILYDGTVRNSLLPLTYTRPVADIRVGILTIREKWEKYLDCTITTLTEDYLEEKYPMVEMDYNVMINAAYLPTESLVKRVKELKEFQAIQYQDEIIAFFTKAETEVNFEDCELIPFKEPLMKIEFPWDIFSLNGAAIEADFNLITHERNSAPIPPTVQCINKDNIFLEEGVEINFAMINASEGPVYIAEGSKIMEGSMIRGPFSLGPNSTVKMGTKIYGKTTVGPYCTVGGELSNAVIFGYSNKGHEGYLGNAVLGEWCNLGADTNNSNLKNNYAEVKMWSYESESFVKTGLQFCGLIMGDHSKCGINTMFNTGTVVGVGTNIYGSNYPRNFIPSFSWGGAVGFTTYKLEKFKEVAEKVMARRKTSYTAVDHAILSHVFEITDKYRSR
ncbi:GlmU family protein [Flavobacteriaceae bacterium F08102]|nr:GlmU family protein [Flavobacteriaceae bacterium F08102]